MRTAQKQQIEEMLRLFEDAQVQLKRYIAQKNYLPAMQLLEECQNGAISMGTLIENMEGEGHPTVSLLEEYCELIYRIHEGLAGDKTSNINKSGKLLQQKLTKISNSIKNDIRIKKEAVFLPYKASMWDSLESIWQAADADPDCDAYVIPIPYFDRNPDGSFCARHYEANQYPGYVPVTCYDDFDFEAHHPDMIFIHNPYDNTNLVTSVHPFFYSDNLKKFTNCLIYVPYFATAGGMSEGQTLCPAYLNADYIVIQSEKYRGYYDANIPDSKFLPLGSPKFDSIVHRCQNPPKPPAGWEEKMKGRKVYFYNTSIGGMLSDTGAFLKKMRYVFDTFKGREDACLLWRPHPLMESTFESMRKAYKPEYEALKQEFISEGTGIYDETPDIEGTIALSDAYIGDTATSVTSLFAAAGKPIFALGNYIHTLPEKDDWRGERINLQFNNMGDDRYQVTANNQLWLSEKNDYHYKFYMDLETGYSGGRYYMQAVEIGDKIYVFPYYAQNLLVIKDKKIRKIEFQKYIIQDAAFFNFWYDEKYIYLFPYQYPAMVRIEIETENVIYIDGIQQFLIRQNTQGEWQAGGVGVYENELIFASPADDQFLFMNTDTLEARIVSSGASCSQGVQGLGFDGDDLWLIPAKGFQIVQWNPKTGKIREYRDVPEDFKAVKWPYEYECEDHPFGGIAFFREKRTKKKPGKEKVIISPNWGNMYLSLDRETGKMEEWKLPAGSANRGKNGYFLTSSMGGFVIPCPQIGNPDCRVWYAPERKLYDINVFTKKYTEVEIEFDYDDLIAHEPGFMEESERMQYCLWENAFNSLKDFLDNHITGHPYDRGEQMKAFSKINVNMDGTCGRNVYLFAKEKG